MNDIASALITSGVLIPTVAWLTRSIIIHSLNKDVESYKLQLNLIAQEHHVKFSKLHEKQAEVISELYRRLLVVKAGIDLARKSNETSFTEKDRLISKKIGDQCIQALLFFQENSLYFPDELHEKLLNFGTKTFGFSALYQSFSDMVDEVTENKPEWKKEAVEKAMVGGWKEIGNSIVGLLDDLKKEFQNILGVKQKMSNQSTHSITASGGSE